MTNTDKITIIGIVINASLFIVSMGWAWLLNRKTIQATLQAAQPVAKPKKKRKLTATERRFLRNFRFGQLGAGLVIISEPYNYLVFNPFPPKSILDWVSAILTLAVMGSFTLWIILIERYEVRQIKTGEFMKRMRQLAREHKKAARISD